MKIKIDNEKKEIEFLSPVSVSELLTELKDLLGDKLDDYKIIVSNTSQQIYYPYPIYVDRTPQPLNPYYGPNTSPYPYCSGSTSTINTTAPTDSNLHAI